MVSELDFDQLFKIPLLFMKINGSHPDVKRNMHWALPFLFTNGVFLTFFCLIVYSIVLHDMKNDFTQVCTNGIVALFYMFVSFQYFMMIWHQNKLRAMIKTMKKDYAGCSPEELILVTKYAYRGKWVTKFWLTVSVISSSLFPLMSVFSMIYYAINHEVRLVPVFELTYPKPLEDIKNDIIPFTIGYIIMVVYTLGNATMYVGLIPMGPIFMLHACSQLEIAKSKIQNFYPKNGYRHVDTIKNMKLVAVQLQDIHG